MVTKDITDKWNYNFPYLERKFFITYLVPIIITIIYLILISAQWKITWDDSGITLAFSRNFAKYGNIIPSQYSDRVEGYSTFLWMIIHSIYFLIGLSEETVLFIAKLSSTLFIVINIFILFKILIKALDNQLNRFVLLLFYTFSMTTVEAGIDGMETALYGTLVLSAYSLYSYRDKKNGKGVLFIIVTSLTILIRHEAILFLIPLFLYGLYIDKFETLKKPYYYIWVVIFLTYQIWHFNYFGELLTNTMIAKNQPPYKPIFLNINQCLIFHWKPIEEFILRYYSIFILIIVGFLFNLLSKNKIITEFKNKLVLLYSTITFGFCFFIGDIWGDAHRLVYPGFPFLLIFLFKLIDNRISKLLNLIYKIVIIITLGLFINTTYELFTQRLVSCVNLRTVEKSGKSLTVLQTLLDIDKLCYAGPDMGGLLLFHGDNKRVVDIGLLCNSYLAKNGYGEFDCYIFEMERPHIIEAHDCWALVTNLYQSEKFFSFYYPVEVKCVGCSNMKFFIRRDLFFDLKEKYNLQYNETQNYTNKKIRNVNEYIINKYGGYYIVSSPSTVPK